VSPSTDTEPPLPCQIQAGSPMRGPRSKTARNTSMRTLPARVNPASRPDCPVPLIMRHGQRAELRCLTYLRRLGASAVSPVIRQIDAPSVLSPVQRAGASSWRDAGPGCLTLTSLASVRMRQDTDERHHRAEEHASPRRSFWPLPSGRLSRRPDVKILLEFRD
jgi:hypothetical protein